MPTIEEFNARIAEETAKYLACCESGQTYFAEPGLQAALQEGNYVSVISSSRIRDTEKPRVV